ncbi:hypothetical protein AB0C12_30765 [Actinoplanes sp. NPDC048967]|uniref:hypothetical protein n=1 Tax=Actinoplanes sp. NPDC048967 TaxID=3155269 RepID=UPI0033EA7BEB
MIDMNEWVAAGTGLLGAAVTVLNGGRLLGTHLRHRAQVKLERERSTRSLARTTGLTHLLNHPHARVRVVERDSDGERLIEIGEPASSGETATR